MARWYCFAQQYSNQRSLALGDASQTYSSSRASHRTRSEDAEMNLNFGKFWESVHHMADTII
jgi:hypothetical protein